MPPGRPMGSGSGMGGLSGQFTRTGRAIAIYYAVVFVIGAILVNWSPFGFVLDSLLLQPLGSGRFELWQPLSHMLVFFPLEPFSLGLQLLFFWMFAFQVEYMVGRTRLLTLLFGVPVVAGLLGLPFTRIGLLQAPFAGFSLALDILGTAFCMVNRNAVVNFMFVVPVRTSRLIWVLVAFHVFFFFPMRQNPWVVYQLISIGLTVLMFRSGLNWDLEEWRLRWKARGLRRKQGRLSVIPGGRDSSDDGPLYH